MSDAQAGAFDQHASYRVGVDIGGTFTDLILVETSSGAITVGKSLTTPTDPSEAVETVLRDALDRSGVAAGSVEHIIHGTTLANIGGSSDICGQCGNSATATTTVTLHRSGTINTTMHQCAEQQQGQAK